MSKMIVYRLRTGQAEYRVTPEKWEAMKVKHAGSMVFIREENEKQVRPNAEAVAGKPVRVEPAPKAPRTRKAKEVKEGKAKEVRTSQPASPAPSADEKETNAAESGSEE